MPELQELLWQAVQFGNDATVRQAVDLWLDDPVTRDDRVARVLELEPSAAVLYPVQRVLTRRRTDLLDTVLGSTPPYGRFLMWGSRWLPPVDGVRVWLPRQQALLARLLTRVAGDPSLPAFTRADSIRQAAGIPELGYEAVRPYLDSSDTVLAEAALGALAWTDRPGDALPLLLAHASDDRARVAVYAARRTTAFVAPSRLEAVLRGALLPAESGAAAPAAKVTSRKELVRLAADRLPVATAVAILTAAFDLPGQHPDVQTACVSVGAQLLPSAQELLERAVDGPPVVQAAVLRVRPFELPAAQRHLYARLVGRVARSGDAETADAAMRLLGVWSPWYPEAASLLLAGTVDLDNRTSWRAAADGLVALATSEEGAGPLLEALSRLVAAEASAADASKERDRPARQRIVHLVGRMSTAVTMRHGAGSLAAAQRAGELLCAVADFVPQGARLAAVSLDLEADAGRLPAALGSLADLHADRPALAARTAATLRSRLDSAGRPGGAAALLHATEQLTATGTYATGLFAVSLTDSLGRRTGWPAEWRARLRALRTHPHADIRDAALSVTTASE
jgi:hypothetical protein